MNEELQILLNDLNRVQRLVEQRKNTLKQLEKVTKKWLTRKYVLDFKFDLSDTKLQTKALKIVNPFKIDALEYSIMVLGTPSSASILSGFSQVSLPKNASYRAFDFEWSIRDNGSDRDWQNGMQPSIFLMSGAYSPLILHKSGFIEKNTEINVSIKPFVNRSGVTGFSSIKHFNVYFSFHGSELL